MYQHRARERNRESSKGLILFPITVLPSFLPIFVYPENTESGNKITPRPTEVAQHSLAGWGIS